MLLYTILNELNDYIVKYQITPYKETLHDFLRIYFKKHDKNNLSDFEKQYYQDLVCQHINIFTKNEIKPYEHIKHKQLLSIMHACTQRVEMDFNLQYQAWGFESGEISEIACKYEKKSIHDYFIKDHNPYNHLEHDDFNYFLYDYKKDYDFYNFDYWYMKQPISLIQFNVLNLILSDYAEYFDDIIPNQENYLKLHGNANQKWDHYYKNSYEMLQSFKKIQPDLEKYSYRLCLAFSFSNGGFFDINEPKHLFRFLIENEETDLLFKCFDTYQDVQEIDNSDYDSICLCVYNPCILSQHEDKHKHDLIELKHKYHNDISFDYLLSNTYGFFFRITIDEKEIDFYTYDIYHEYPHDDMRYFCKDDCKDRLVDNLASNYENGFYLAYLVRYFLEIEV